MVKACILAYETLEIYVKALKRHLAWKYKCLFPWNITQFFKNFVPKSCHSRHKIINGKLFSSFTYEVMSLTITDFFIVGLKIRRDKYLTVSNYVFILALDYFVGFKFPHAWKKKYEHPEIKQTTWFLSSL